MNDSKVKIVSQEEVISLFDELLPWDKKEVLVTLLTKYSDIAPDAVNEANRNKYGY
jgi:hypothetical protein